MMAAINQGSFGGRQVVTCYTCHRGSDRPKVTPSLAAIYSAPPPDEPPDIITPAQGAPSADQVFDKYLQAVGGAQRLAALTSFVAKGSSVGYGPEGTMRPIEIFAKGPDQRTMIIHTLDGDSTTTYDGRAGWAAAPHRPVAVLPLTGGDLGGLKLDAELSFPADQTTLGNWRVGASAPSTITTCRWSKAPAAARSRRSTSTASRGCSPGSSATPIRAWDGFPPVRLRGLRDVSGVIPFRWKMTWLDGFEGVATGSTELPIDATKFAKPR